MYGINSRVADDVEWCRERTNWQSRREGKRSLRLEIIPSVSIVLAANLITLISHLSWSACTVYTDEAMEAERQQREERKQAKLRSEITKNSDEDEAMGDDGMDSDDSFM